MALSSTRRLGLPAAASFVVAVLCSACSGGSPNPGGSSATPPPVSPTTPAVPTSPPPPGTAVYTYKSGVASATLTIRGREGRLAVENSSQEDFGRPGIYVLRATDGSRIDARVENAHPVRQGTSGTFQVVFPKSFSLADVGVVNLTFGGQDFGSFFGS